MPESNKPVAFNPPTLPEPPPTYKHVAVTPLSFNSTLITLAGQVGVDVNSGKAAATFPEQVRTAYVNLFNALAAAGASPRDIIHVRHYIVKDTDDPELNKLDCFDRGWAPIWLKFMQENADGHLPPDTVLGVAGLAKKELLYEVEAWAIIHR